MPLKRRTEANGKCRAATKAGRQCAAPAIRGCIYWDSELCPQDNYWLSRGSDISARVLPSVSSNSASHTSRSARVAILCGSDRNATPRELSVSRICWISSTAKVEDRPRVVEARLWSGQHQPRATAIEECQTRRSREQERQTEGVAIEAQIFLRVKKCQTSTITTNIMRATTTTSHSLQRRHS
jgi:hypothetical protein